MMKRLLNGWRMGGGGGRFASSTSPRDSMFAWQIDSYNSNLSMNKLRVPRIDSPTDMLVEVKAASVNPIDVRMKGGYGDAIVGVMRQISKRSINPVLTFPLTLGRDCSGIVREVGRGVRRFRPGDEVYCAIGAQRPGTHAQFVLADESSAAKKPRTLSHVKAAALPYVSATVWSALVSIARLKPGDCSSVRVLVHGGAGGIGSLAIQLLRAWGATVVTTCSADSFDMVKSLGAIPVDYRSEKAFDELAELSPFDVVLDGVDSPLARQSADLMGIWRNSVHVSVVSPILRDCDQLGFPLGLFKSAATYFSRSAEPASKGRWFSYAFFAPSSDCLEHVASLADDGKVKPVIERVLPFSEMPAAYDKVGELHGRGKTVIDFEESSSSSSALRA